MILQVVTKHCGFVAQHEYWRSTGQRNALLRFWAGSRGRTAFPKPASERTATGTAAQFLTSILVGQGTYPRSQRKRKEQVGVSEPARKPRTENHWNARIEQVLLESLTATRSDCTWALKDRQLTGFSNEEETQAGFAGNAPWLLEDRLRISGARYIAKAPWTPHALVDGNLVTGQPNYSAGITADAVLKQPAVAV
jgi:hypothetical protein